MKTMRMIDKEITTYQNMHKKLEEEKEEKYQSYEYFLSEEFSNKIFLLFEEGYDKHPELKEELKLLCEILDEYIYLNQNLRDVYYRNNNEKIKLYNFISPNNKIYLLLIIKVGKTKKREIKTYVSEEILNNNIIPKFEDLKNLVRVILKNRVDGIHKNIVKKRTV